MSLLCSKSSHISHAMNGASQSPSGDLQALCTLASLYTPASLIYFLPPPLLTSRQFHWAQFLKHAQHIYAHLKAFALFVPSDQKSTLISNIPNISFPRPLQIIIQQSPSQQTIPSNLFKIIFHPFSTHSQLPLVLFYFPP